MCGMLKNLSRIDKAFLIALILRVVDSLTSAIMGAPLPLDGLIRAFFIIASIVFLIASFPKLLRKLLWRVRHRLLVTWFFVGVVPIVLICALAVEGVFILMGQVVSYMTTNEIVRQSELLRSAAGTFVWSVEHRAASMTLPV